MKKIDWKMLGLTLVVCCLPILFGIAFYARLPEKMAIHFKIDNAPDGFASKNFALFGIPLFMMAMQLFCCILSDVKQTKEERSPKFIVVIKWLIPILSVMTSILTIEISLGSAVEVRTIVCAVLGILFMVIGNYMPKVSYENVKGMMHPMPKNEEIFGKFMRLQGYTFVLVGLLLVISIFCQPMVTVGVMVGMIVVMVLETIFLAVQK